jgi:CRP-like cAMP-binding protein
VAGFRAQTAAVALFVVNFDNRSFHFTLLNLIYANNIARIKRSLLFLQQKEKCLKDFFQTLHKCALFEAIAEEDLLNLLNCLSARKVTQEAGSFVFTAGDKITSVGIVLSGCLHLIQDDFWGNRSIISAINPADVFGEVFSFTLTEHIPVSVMAAEQSEIILINYKKIITVCSESCPFHTALICNMLKILAEKTLLLMKKMDAITQRSTREKVRVYLSGYAAQTNSASFEIPFNRQQLADYLSVERSALSAELCRMRTAGIIDFNKNKFTLCNC